MQTSGLLILITDGDLANKLMHPSSQLQREYAVRVVGELPQADLRKLRKGISLEDGPARFDEINFTGGEALNRWYRVVVSQGRNRVVRRLFDAIGCTVSRLIRVRYGPVRLPKDLHRGQHRSITPAEFDSLRDAVGLSASKRVHDN
jgi:23S rRNA pseudouridine2605 synthase